jgi:cholesterol transport system auxiliary component
MTRNMLQLLLITSFIFISGCSGLLTSKQNVHAYYTLNAAKDFSQSTQVLNHTIMIEKPIMSKGLDTNQIILMKSPQHLDYYAGARWSDTLSNMAQVSLLETFENSEILSRVTMGYSGINADYLLVTEIYDFEAVYENINEAPIIHIRMVAKLVTFPERELVASFGVDVHEHARANKLDTIMAAFDHAFQGAQKLIVEETLDYFAQE